MAPDSLIVTDTKNLWSNLVVDSWENFSEKESQYLMWWLHLKVFNIHKLEILRLRIFKNGAKLNDRSHLELKDTISLSDGKSNYTLF